MIFYERKYINDKDFSSFGAFSYDETVTFNLMIPRKCGACSVSMHLSGEGLENKYYNKFDFVWTSIEGAYDVYACELDLKEIGVGLYYYKYEVDAPTPIYLGGGKKVTELKRINNLSDGMITAMVCGINEE